MWLVSSFWPLKSESLQATSCVFDKQIHKSSELWTFINFGFCSNSLNSFETQLPPSAVSIFALVASTGLTTLQRLQQAKINESVRKPELVHREDRIMSLADLKILNSGLCGYCWWAIGEGDFSSLLTVRWFFLFSSKVLSTFMILNNCGLLEFD